MSWLLYPRRRHAYHAVIAAHPKNSTPNTDVMPRADRSMAPTSPTLGDVSTAAERRERNLGRRAAPWLGAATNRAGRLTPEQARHLRSDQMTDRRIFLLLGIPATIISGLWLVRAAVRSGLGGLLGQRLALVIFAVGLVLIGGAHGG